MCGGDWCLGSHHPSLLPLRPNQGHASCRRPPPPQLPCSLPNLPCLTTVYYHFMFSRRPPNSLCDGMSFSNACLLSCLIFLSPLCALPPRPSGCCVQSGKAAAGKKVVAKKGTKVVKAAPKENPLFPSRPRSFRIGGAIQVCVHLCTPRFLRPRCPSTCCHGTAQSPLSAPTSPVTGFVRVITLGSTHPHAVVTNGGLSFCFVALWSDLRFGWPRCCVVCLLDGSPRRTCPGSFAGRTTSACSARRRSSSSA